MSRTRSSGQPGRYDAVIIGGGFYGCCLALYLRSIMENVLVLEREGGLLSRASFVNQARIHTGFHYPRSFTTARRSLALYQRFVEDFRPAVVDNFQMLYAIARYGSKISAGRFATMFRAIGAPISEASEDEVSLFSTRLIESVMRCEEFSFNAAVLQDILFQRLNDSGVSLLLDTAAGQVLTGKDRASIVVETAQGAFEAPFVFDTTYGQLAADGLVALDPFPFKYEQTEIALVQPPPELAQYGVTVMDGPFFSIMPFPARECYSLTHVRYTPHAAWSQSSIPHRPAPPNGSRWMHMQRDAVRYLPCMKGVRPVTSLFETKTVLLRNEGDDGRPILLHQNPVQPGYMTILGGKLDNIYDLFEALTQIGPPFDKGNLEHFNGR